MKISQSIKNFKAKRIRLKLLLRAHKAERIYQKLYGQISYFTQKYLMETGFKMTDFEVNMTEYVNNLEQEAKEEMEFFTYVFEHHCTDQGPNGEIREVSPKHSAWH